MQRRLVTINFAKCPRAQRLQASVQGLEFNAAQMLQIARPPYLQNPYSKNAAERWAGLTTTFRAANTSTTSWAVEVDEARGWVIPQNLGGRGWGCKTSDST